MGWLSLVAIVCGFAAKDLSGVHGLLGWLVYFLVAFAVIAGAMGMFLRLHAIDDKPSQSAGPTTGLVAPPTGQKPVQR